MNAVLDHKDAHRKDCKCGRCCPHAQNKPTTCLCTHDEHDHVAGLCVNMSAGPNGDDWCRCVAYRPVTTIQ